MGCIECRNTGYLGRIGIYEIMQVTREMRPTSASTTDLAALTQVAYKTGMRPLRVSGATKIAQGMTTVRGSPEDRSAALKSREDRISLMERIPQGKGSVLDLHR